MRLKDAAPEAAPIDVKTIKAAAVRQVIASRTPPEYRTFDGPGGPTRIQTGGGEYKTPSNLAEWTARMITQTPTDGVGSCLIVILAAAAQGGARTAAAAVAVAGRLSVHDQWALWNALGRMTGGLPDANAVLAEVSREWKRLRLQSSVPVQPLILEQRWTPTNAGPGTAYSPAVPDEMKAPGGRVNA